MTSEIPVYGNVEEGDPGELFEVPQVMQLAVDPVPTIEPEDLEHITPDDPALTVFGSD